MIFLFVNKLDPTINIRFILIFNFDLVQLLCNQVIKKVQQTTENSYIPLRLPNPQTVTGWFQWSQLVGIF